MLSHKVMETYKLAFLSLFLLIFIQALLYIKTVIFNKKKLPPGPKGLPVIGNLLAMGTRPHESLAELAKVHGPLMTVKLGFQTIVVATSAELAGEILQKQDQAFFGRPETEGFTARPNYDRSVVLMSGGPKWKNLRKIMNTHVFTTHRVEGLQGLRRQMVDGMVKSLTEASDARECVDIGKLVFGTAFNLMSNMIFSDDILDTKSDALVELKQHMKKIIQSVIKPNLADCFPFLKPFDPQGIRREVKTSYERLQALVNRLIEQRIKRRLSGSPRSDDILDIFLDQCNESSESDEFTVEDVNILILDLIIGGSDTTAATIEWAMAELLRNPHLMAKAKQELKETMESSHRIDEKNTPKLTYLQMVIKETMRLHPASPLTLRKALVDEEIYGYAIPKNTQVMVNAWALERDPIQWDRPTEFLPERFLVSDIDFRGNNLYYMPFGSGRRICPGLPLAVRMLGLVLASLIHRFDWELPDGMSPQDIDMSDKFGLALQKAVPLLATPMEIPT